MSFADDVIEVIYTNFKFIVPNIDAGIRHSVASGTPLTKWATSGGIHLRGLAPGQHSSTETSLRRRHFSD